MSECARAVGTGLGLLRYEPELKLMCGIESEKDMKNAYNLNIGAHMCEYIYIYIYSIYIIYIYIYIYIWLCPV